MVNERARQPDREGVPLRVVKGRAEETPLLDLADGVRLYLNLLEQARQFEAMASELRGRILRTMEQAGMEEFSGDGVRAVRQIRRYAPKLDLERATELLERAGRLEEAEKTVLDAEKVRQVLEDLYQQGKVRKEELPYGKPREVAALIVREIEEARGD